MPLTITTTCLDCASTRLHTSGPIVDLLVASCSLPGLLPPVVLPDGHAHVDGGVLCGVPIAAALSAAGPADLVVVLDFSLAPVTGTAGRCTAMPWPGPTQACGLGRTTAQWIAPAETRRGALDVVLRSFTVARRRGQPGCGRALSGRSAGPRHAARRGRLGCGDAGARSCRSSRLPAHRRARRGRARPTAAWWAGATASLVSAVRSGPD